MTGVPIICPSCGRKYQQRTRFCTSCGAPMDMAPAQPQPVYEPPRTEPLRAAPLPTTRPREPISSPPSGPHDRRTPIIGAAAIVLLLALAGAGLAIGGVFKSSPRSPHHLLAQHTTPTTAKTHTSTTRATTSSTSTTSTSPTTTSSTTSTTPTTAAATQTATFSGAAFSIDYPAGWVVKTAEKQFSWGTDTTIVSSTDPRVALRVDITPNVKTTSPLSSGASVISALARQPGYRLLSLSSNSIDGLAGEYWEFLVTESGASMHKVDEFLISPTNSEGIAILTQAPASEWASWSQMFTAVRTSFHSTAGT